MTRKKLLIPLSLILITLLPLVGCSVKDDANKVEPIENTLINNVFELTLSEATFSEMEELENIKGISELKINNLRKDEPDSEYNGTLDFVRYLPDLRSLEVTTSSDILDASGLTAPGLWDIKLRAENGSIVQLDALSRLSELRNLSIHAAGTLSLEPLARCSSLENLSLSCDSTDITPLASSTSLRSLGIISGAPDLSGLAANRSLEQLVLYETSKGLEALGEVPFVYIVAIECASFKLEQLKGLSTVEAIAISDEYISDITALSSMDNIKSIFLSTAAKNEALDYMYSTKRIYLPKDANDDFGTGIRIYSADSPELDLISTSIPINQLREFLSKEGTSIAIYDEWKR